MDNLKKRLIYLALMRQMLESWALEVIKWVNLTKKKLWFSVEGREAWLFILYKKAQRRNMETEIQGITHW